MTDDPLCITNWVDLIPVLEKARDEMRRSTFYKLKEMSDHRTRNPGERYRVVWTMTMQDAPDYDLHCPSCTKVMELDDFLENEYWCCTRCQIIIRLVR